MLHKITAILFHSRFIVCHPGRPGPHRDHSAAAPLLLPTSEPATVTPMSPRPWRHRGRSPAAPCWCPPRTPMSPSRPAPTVVVHRQQSLLVPAADTDVAQVVPPSTMAVHRQHRCCYLPWTRYYPTDVTQAVPAPYRGIVHRQRRCLCPPRTPMSPRPSRSLPWSFTGSAAADARRGLRCRPGRPGPPTWSHRVAPPCPPTGPAITLPMSPRPSRPLPWSFTGSAAAGARRGHRCHPGSSRPLPRPFTGSAAAATYGGLAEAPTDVAQAVPTPYRGRSPVAPLLVPAADPLLPYRCRPGRPGPLPRPFADSAAAGARRGHRCRPGRPGPYRGRSPAAPLLMPGPADADVAQAVPASPRPFADSTAAAGSGPAVTTPTVRGRSPTAPPLTRCCPADANQAVPAATDVVHRQHRCCCLPRSHRCPIDVAQAVPAATDVVHRQHRCCYLQRTRCCPTPHRGRSPASPLLLPPAADPLCSTDANQAVPADGTADDHRCSRCCGLLCPRCCPTDVPRKAPGYLCRCSMKIAPTRPIKIYTIFRNWGEYRYYISKDRIDSSYLNRCP